MDWIQTYTGRRFYPLAPRGEDVDIRDIAHALAMLCRFNGHCRWFYSVAEHSVRCSRLLDGSLALWALLHDAAEAYLTDLPRPVKGQFPQFCEYEDRVMAVVLPRFGLTIPASGGMPPEVVDVDDRLLATEARDLMGEPPEKWSYGGLPLPDRIVPMSPEQAERAFLMRYEELTGQRLLQ